jgi:tetratricopeptide (TPR) repeat protein
MSDDSNATAASPVQRASSALIQEAHALSDAGRYADALRLVVDELARLPDDAELKFARASVLFDWGRIREACAAFLQAESAGVMRPALYLNIAWSYQMLGLPDRAEPYVRKAIVLEPGNVAANFGLGTVLRAQKRMADAIACFERVLELDPQHVEAIAGIGQCMLEQKAYADAEAWFRRGIGLATGNALLHINLGAALINQTRYEESLVALNVAAELEAAHGALPLSMTDTGFALVSTGQYERALDVLRRGLPKVPDPRAHGYYAFLLLALGRFREGWAQFEFRWLQEPSLSKRPMFDKPNWAGQDPAGKTILLIDEQGAGDIINFVRFAVPLQAMGARVVLQVRPELVRLAHGFAGVDQVVSRGEVLPAFDYYLHLMSLPHAFGIELTTIPAAVPYVRADPAKLEEWAPRFSDAGLDVGVAWAGNPLYPRDNFRSMPLPTLRPLWDVPGVRFHSLQKPLKDGELAQFPTTTPLANLGPDLSDFADTAAAIAHLDLVICVDTAIAHLAGALGKPVWLMLPAVGDYRWLDGRDDSPWYPTMRLFRQRKLGEWDEVIARVASALHAVVTTQSLGAPAIVPPASPQPALSAAPADIACVTEARCGIVQYLPDMDDTARSLAWYGEHRQLELEVVSRLIQPGACIVEAGSGFGEHTIPLARRAAAQGQLWSYETSPVVRQLLRQNLDANRAAGNVTIMRNELAGPRAAGGEAATETLDELRLERLDLLKLRSGTAAADILAGASETLWRLRPTLCVAAEDDEAIAQLAPVIAQHGYRCWRMESPLFNPNNFNRRDADIFAGATALALIAVPEEVDAGSVLDGRVELTEVNGAPKKVTADDGATSGLLGKLRKLLR